MAETNKDIGNLVDLEEIQKFGPIVSLRLFGKIPCNSISGRKKTATHDSYGIYYLF